MIRRICLAGIVQAVLFLASCASPRPGSPPLPRTTPVTFQPKKWTTNDTKEYWADIVELSTRTSTAPRFADADESRGEGILEEFGTRYMPNAYAHYQKSREIAKEREQVLAENFPDNRYYNYETRYKVEKACSKAVAEMFRRHDELCHFFLLHRMGAVSGRELAEHDAKRISIVLPPEDNPPRGLDLSAPVLAQAEIDFATKYLPEILASLQRLDNAFSEGIKSYDDWRETALVVDAARASFLFDVLRDRQNGIHALMEAIVELVGQQKLLHAVGEVSASDLADIDRDTGADLRKEEKSFSVDLIIREVVRNSISFIKQTSRQGIVMNMVQIPGQSYLMGKFEVTEAQWEAVMGEKPHYQYFRSRGKVSWYDCQEFLKRIEGIEGESYFKPDLCFRLPDAGFPVTNVSWNDCQEFLKRLNALPEIKLSGLKFRLPTEREWEYACRAGATGKYCKLANGTEITDLTLNRVAWCREGEVSMSPVGQKQPNAFGLYDMYGNVSEWTSTVAGVPQSPSVYRVIRGGNSGMVAKELLSRERICNIVPAQDRLDVGFRLCADKVK